MPVQQALKALRAHVDLPVALPKDDLSLRNYRGWLADLNLYRYDGEPVGSIQLRKRNQILSIDVGQASSDGCGGRDTAIPTTVGGEPALVWVSPNAVWSRIVWPVEPRGHIGVYGLAGTFEGWQMVRLARSMHKAITAEPIHDDGC